MDRLKVLISIVIALFVYITAYCQEEQPILESRFRNPVDTTKMLHGSEPSLILFIHKGHKDNEKCPARKAQVALEKDSLGLRNKYGVKLYVICDEMSTKELVDFDSCNPTNAIFAYDKNNRFRNLFPGDKKSVPFLIANDGKGHLYYKHGFVNLLEFVDDVYNPEIQSVSTICPECNGDGLEHDYHSLELRRKCDPDYWVCRRCRGSKVINIKKYKQ